MQIQTHILTNIPVFKVEDSLKAVVKFFKNTTFSHVAVIEKGKFLGVLSEDDLENLKVDEKIEGYRYGLDNFFTRKDANWLDVLEGFARNEANLLPVLGENEEVLGYYDLTDVVGVFIDTPFFTEPGNILVVAKGTKDYSFSEVAQIVESNNAKYIGGFITGMMNDVVQITIKISTENFSDVVQTFRRYNYNIVFGNSDDKFLEDLKERSNYLDKYLNV
ncbi:CBS domain-containing protein [uncultured Maribacter sp.]|uniref:CBS domain-containing protein n=1 Tax=uncultured Maribacter sp. TaxID=431308 RepID=UPI002638D796|nr:CBS domain-containing protein [uncultured Maribacter sp.]